MLKKAVFMLLVILSVPLYAAAALVNIPKTGQNLCYDTSLDLTANLGAIPCAGTGQDGETQFGSVPPVPRFTDNLDGTVTDNQSSLTWLMDMRCSTLNPLAPVPITNNNGGNTWSGALTLVNALAAPACGLSDGSTAGTWRLPNVNELESLVDLSQNGPPLPAGHPFTNYSSNRSDYWSSTITPLIPFSNAEAVDMFTGTLRGDVQTNLKSVWAVKDTAGLPTTVAQTGQTVCWDSSGTPLPSCPAGTDGAIHSGVPFPSGTVVRFTDNKDGTLTDQFTGLTWLQQASCFSNISSQAQALNAAKTLASGSCGLTDGTVAGDWRLSNRNEMRSLNNYDQLDGGAWLLSQGFTSPGGNPITGWYWTSDSYAGIISDAQPLARNLKWLVKTEGGSWTNDQVDLAFPSATNPRFALPVRTTVPTFTVSFVAGANGTLTGTASQVVISGASAAPVTAVPAAGYSFVQWTGAGSFTSTNNPLTLTNVTADQTLTASFAVNSFAVDFAAGANGSLTGTASQIVASGAAATPVSAVPAAGYHFVQWTGSGGFTSTDNPLTLANVTAAQTLTASFAVNTFTVSFAAGANGSLTGTASQAVASGASAAPVTAVPAAGFNFVQWTGAGGFTSTDNPLTLTNVTADQTLTASFAVNTFSVKFAAGANGSLTGTVDQTVAGGASATPVSAVPATGYHFVQWAGAGAFTSTDNPLTVTNVTASQTLTASFATDTFLVTDSAPGGNGSISCTPQVNYGSNCICTITPDAGFHLLTLTDNSSDKLPSVSGNSFTITGVTGNHVVSATFARPTGILTPVNGKTTPDLADALAVLKMALKINQPTAADIARADVAPLGADGKPLGDGQLDLYDVIGVLRMMLGLN